jgi:hypothetical protein
MQENQRSILPVALYGCIVSHTRAHNSFPIRKNHSVTDGGSLVASGCVIAIGLRRVRTTRALTESEGEHAYGRPYR